MFTGWYFSLGVIIVITLKYDAVLSSPLKIVNGTDAELGDAPYMVSLHKDDGRLTCGGSIIAPDWILTAAHCIRVKVPHSIGYGGLRRSETEKPEHSILVKRGIKHPKYNSTTKLFDIALLQLEETIPFEDNVQPVQLPDSDDVPFHVDGVLTGWGYGSEEGPDIPNLQKIPLQLLSDEQCLAALNSETFGNLFNPIQHLCTDDHNNGHCYGDSGGPYVINGIQYGVVNWAINPCGSHPGVYSRISSPKHLQWIKETIKS